MKIRVDCWFNLITNIVILSAVLVLGALIAVPVTAQSKPPQTTPQQFNNAAKAQQRRNQTTVRPNSNTALSNQFKNNNLTAKAAANKQLLSRISTVRNNLGRQAKAHSPKPSLILVPKGMPGIKGVNRSAFKARQAQANFRSHLRNLKLATVASQKKPPKISAIAKAFGQKSSKAPLGLKLIALRGKLSPIFNYYK